VVQRHVLYLGEINDTQELAWRRSIAVLEDGAAQPGTLSLFPGDRCEGLLADALIVRPPVPQQIRSRFRESGHFSHDGLTVSRPGTGSSNPSPSSGESCTNLR
jgi:hypothetical protein